MKHHQKLFTLCLAVATLVLPAAAAAQCTPSSPSLGIQFLDLKQPFEINTTRFGTPPQAANMLLEGPTPSNHPECSGWYEAVIKITIPDGCTQANIWIEYEGLPIDWSLNAGDTITNNGFGGDFGEPESEAELQIRDEILTVFSSGISPGIVDRLAEEHLSLTDGALKIVVRDQYVSWGPPFQFLDTENSELLFKLPDPAAAEPNAFYLGINRVVDQSLGDRNGCGVRRVLVSFS